MTAAKEKAIRAYLASIPADEDRNGMMGYRFLTRSRTALKRVAVKAPPKHKIARQKCKLTGG